MEERENSAKEKVESLSNEEKTENEKAQNRVKVAKEKMQKKESEKKAKLASQKQKQKKKAEREKAKLALKKEKQAKREQLKNETKEQRDIRLTQERQAKQEQIAAFKAEKLRLKREKQAQKTLIKQQKLENKAKAKADKREKREERSKRRSSRGVGGWIAAVVSLGMSTLILASILTVNLFGGLKEFPQSTISQGYMQSYEELVDYNQNIDVNMSKFFVSNSKREQQKILIKISEESLLAEENFQRLPISQMNKHYTAKVINQVGDYAKYLNNKLIDGLSITQEDRENFYRLYEYNREIKDSLAKISSEIAKGEKIEDLFKDDEFAFKVLMELEDKSVVYPQLIYDGPFSDGLNAREVKGLNGKEITASQAEKIFKSVFSEYKLNMHEVVGEYNGQIKCYTLSAKDELGEYVYAQISKVGGKVVMFDYNKRCQEDKEMLSRQECINVGLEFLKSLEINNMKAVWCEETDTFITINYAYEQEGVIVYPDIVKLNICKDEGKVLGMEATNYYLNHTNRDIANVKLSKQKAIENVGANLEVDSVRLALIPKGNYKEVLTYEIYGESQDGAYYVYVNANNGEEEQIFKVVSTSQGDLLI